MTVIEQHTSVEQAIHIFISTTGVSRAHYIRGRLRGHYLVCNVYESKNQLDQERQIGERGICTMYNYIEMLQPFFLLLPLFRRLSPPWPLPLAAS